MRSRNVASLPEDLLFNENFFALKKRYVVGVKESYLVVSIEARGTFPNRYKLCSLCVLEVRCSVLIYVLVHRMNVTQPILLHLCAAEVLVSA